MTKADGKPAQYSVAEIKARYRVEREKRLRPDTTAQYHELSGVFGDFDQDPYADPNFQRAAVVEDTDAVIIGAGLGGLMTGARLVQNGVKNFRIIDKAGDFGGTWYWNRYPGAACDVESYIYLPLLEETGYVPIEKYSKAPEIFAHCQRIAHQFDLYPRALFQTLVKDVRWLEDSSRWEVTTDRNDRLRAKFVVIAGGILHKAKLPGIPGIEKFKGRTFHTSRWDYNYTGGSPSERMTNLADKRVALIGTGATSVQVVPRLAESAQQLIVFQRTPSAVGVRGNQLTDPKWKASLKPGWQAERIDNFTRIVSGQAANEDLIKDGWTEIFTRNPNAFGVMRDEEHLLDWEAMEAIRARIDATIVDPATAAALKPWYNQMCKRPCFHDEYLPAFNRSNVSLVDTAGKGVDRITEDAVVVDGVTYPVDCIVFASGFESSSSHKSRLGFEIHGRNGISLTEAWAGGAATLHGLFARGFPNLMIFHTLQGGIAINFSHVLSELARHAAWVIARSDHEAIAQLEPTLEAQDAWFQILLSRLGAQAMFFAECTPGNFNSEGNMDPAGIRSVPFFGPTLEFLQILKNWRTEGRMEGLEVKHREFVKK